MEKIIWSKEYQEDVGDKDENGDYSYAYHYHIYWFNLPDGRKIKARRYTDTPSQCSLFGEPEDINFKKLPPTRDYLSAIVNFLIEKEGVEKIEYFIGGYKPIDLSKIKKNLKDFVFQKK